MRRPFFYVPPLQADFCRLLSLARADTHTRPTTHIHLSVLPHGGFRPDERSAFGASGGERSLSWGAGASPATAHRAAAGPALKVRNSLGASNSPHICLIHTFCLSLLPSLWPSNCPADTCTHPFWLPAASWRWRTHPRMRLASMGRREALCVAQVPVRMAVWGGILVARS